MSRRPLSLVQPLVLVLGAALLVGLGLACSAAKEPEIGAEGSATGDAVAANAAARQTREDERVAAAAAAPAEDAAAALPEPVPSASGTPAVAVSDLPARDTEDATVIVIDRGGQEAAPTLAEAGRRARRERAESSAATPSVASVTNENLHEYQDGQITFAKPTAEPKKSGPAAGEGGIKAASRGEAYWKGRVLDLRIALRDAVDELSELEGRAARLRTSFYAEDDPYVRDGRIKPAWDRTLDRIAELQKQLLSTRKELNITLEEGRAAGALPGWLREGLDIEPLPEDLPPPRDEDGIHHPGQPVIFDEGPP